MRILIVEDELLVRQRLLRMCTELAGSRARFDAVADLDAAAVTGCSAACMTACCWI
jgi:hypothetical protein